MTERKIEDLVNLLTQDEKINVADVGASAIMEEPVYKMLVESGLGHLYAFDGDERHIEKLQGLYGTEATILSDFLGDGKEHTAYICHPNTGMTSLFKPSQKALEFFNGFSKFGDVVKEEKVSTKKLNDISEIDDIHFMKMDIQGSELNVLKNGLDKLSNCVAI